MIGFFTRHRDGVVAEPIARSVWNSDHLGGPPVSGLLAREVETCCPDGFVPARLTVDLFRPVLDRPIMIRSETVRRGRRITVADAAIVQNDQVRARATALFLSPGAAPPGQVWSAGDELPAPPEGAVQVGDMPLFRSGAGGWNRDGADHQNDDRKICWAAVVLPLVAGEPLTPFQHAAMVADFTNQVCHWGSRGVGYINADVTMTLSRPPVDCELGLRAEDAVPAEGILIGTATLYDRIGALGTCVVTALSNGDHPVDLAVTTR
ncbi:acyl-CoA thioesterase domain-containing protein [Nocardia asiatica]|uniref:acyl-CoA thioesterase domain-containing protein n=1 Tax=Nocardia asiatica TaxID=209252 RepID=UPI003EE004FB